MISTLEVLFSRGLISNLRKFKVDSIVSWPLHNGFHCSHMVLFATFRTWVPTIEQSLGSPPMFWISPSNTFLSTFGGARLKKFVLLFRQFGSNHPQWDLACSLSSLSFKKFGVA
ncbi:hypothetical protein LINPERPRIM_LOCUS8497 [Linum perenne]